MRYQTRPERVRALQYNGYNIEEVKELIGCKNHSGQPGGPLILWGTYRGDGPHDLKVNGWVVRSEKPGTILASCWTEAAFREHFEMDHA